MFIYLFNIYLVTLEFGLLKSRAGSFYPLCIPSIQNSVNICGSKHMMDVHLGPDSVTGNDHVTLSEQAVLKPTYEVT